MQKTSLVTLLTDFGQSDVYVGVMQGVIASINPHIQVISLTHQIPPQDVAAGRFCLMNAYPYFPPDTVHIGVVDPGVGSRRRAIALQLDGGFLVGPDNGLFSGVISQYPVLAAVELTNPEYWRTPEPSATFHGRDIFAPVGAHLASGVPLTYLGKTIDPSTLVQLPIAPYTCTDAEIIGCIQYCDRFGNLITNIPGNLITGKNCTVSINDRIIASGNTYSDVPPGSAIALVGSHGWVEIAINGGSAAIHLNLKIGAMVTIRQA